MDLSNNISCLKVGKVRRCSDRSSYTADVISEVQRMMSLRDRMCEILSSILSWVCNPSVDMEWSKAILKDIEACGGNFSRLDSL